MSKINLYVTVDAAKVTQLITAALKADETPIR